MRVIRRLIRFADAEQRLSPEQKHAISHRGKALAQAVVYLRDIFR